MASMNQDGQKAYQYVYDYLCGQILRGELSLHDRLLPEREMAAQLGVSRTTVREVMHMLESGGLIECVQGSGNYICCDPEEYMIRSFRMVIALMGIHYDEIFHVRRGLEFASLKLAMENITDEELVRMDKILTEMENMSEANESSKLDMEFHTALINASRNRMLVLFLEMINDLMSSFIEDYRIKILSDDERAEDLKDSHREIYDALVNRDYEAGKAAMEKHFTIVREQVDKFAR